MTPLVRNINSSFQKCVQDLFLARFVRNIILSDNIRQCCQFVYTTTSNFTFHLYYHKVAIIACFVITLCVLCSNFQAALISFSFWLKLTMQSIYFPKAMSKTILISMIIMTGILQLNICFCFWLRQAGTWQEGGDSNGRRGQRAGEKQKSRWRVGGWWSWWWWEAGSEVFLCFILTHEFDENFVSLQKETKTRRPL